MQKEKLYEPILKLSDLVPGITIKPRFNSQNVSSITLMWLNNEPQQSSNLQKIELSYSIYNFERQSNSKSFTFQNHCQIYQITHTNVH
jgi:hypothetical protein